MGDHAAGHEEMRTLLGAYVLGALRDDDRATALEAHLAECEPCREELWKLADVVTHRGAAGEARRDIWERIRDRIARQGELE